MVGVTVRVGSVAVGVGASPSGLGAFGLGLVVSWAVGVSE